MSAKLYLSAVAAALLLSPAPLLAGGLPRVCLPVDGVTADNTNACVKRVADALGARGENVEVRENGKQWYVLFNYNGGALALSQLDKAFKGSPFSVPRDHLRLFGPVRLEVQIDEATTAKFLADLKEVKHLRVVESKREGGILVVTADTPMTRHMARETLEFGRRPFDQEVFGENEFGVRVEPPVTARELPSCAVLRAIVEKHNGTLKEVGWQLVGCNVQGGVVVPNTPEKQK